MNKVPVQALEVQPKSVYDLPKRAGRMGLEKKLVEDMVEQLRLWGLTEHRYGKEHLIYGTADGSLSKLMEDPRWSALVFQRSKYIFEELHVVEGVHNPTAEKFEASLNFLMDPRHGEKGATPVASASPAAPAVAPAAPVAGVV